MSIPVNVCGIAVAILGFSDVGCIGGASSTTIITGSQSGGGNGDAGQISALSGNDVNAPISAPLNVCGVSLAVASFADSGCKGGSFRHPRHAGCRGRHPGSRPRHAGGQPPPPRQRSRVAGPA